MELQFTALEERLAVAWQWTDLPAYDFTFERFFSTSSRAQGLPGVVRLGAFQDYHAVYSQA